MNVADRLSELELNPGKLTGQMKDISEELRAPIQEYLATLGLELTFRVANLTCRTMSARSHGNERLSAASFPKATRRPCKTSPPSAPPAPWRHGQ